MNKKDKIKKQKRKIRNREKLRGIESKPRIVVFRSNYYFYAQAINDQAGISVAGVKSSRNPKVDNVKTLGEEFGKRLQKDFKISEAKYDRSGYKYHGKVSAFAEGLRSSGITI